VPGGSITYKNDIIVWTLLREVFQKDIHTNRIAVWKNEKVSIAGYRINSAIGIPVLPNMMTRHPWTYPLPAPAMLRLVDTPKACFVLKHEPNTFSL
jgi:hypothetical protein